MATEISAHETTRDQDRRRIRHHLRFRDPVTYDEARQWLARKDWLGFHPATYGPDRLMKAPGIGRGDILVASYDTARCSEWIWEHYAAPNQ